MKRTLTRAGQILAGTLAIPIIILGMVTTLSVHASPPAPVTICHATSSETNPWNTLHVNENALNGHFENNGTTKAGHEGDIVLQGHVECPVPEDEDPEPRECEEGTHNVGTKEEPICNDDPTGCPYGDSIPLDSPKCAPSEVENTTPTPVETQETEVFYGK